MPQTNIERKASYYERVIEDSQKSPLSPKYEAVSKALKELMELSRNLNNPDVKMTAEDYENLNGKYSAVQAACSTYLESDVEISKFEKSRMGIIKDIARVTQKDMDMLAKCDTKQPGSLSEVIAKSRTRTAVINSGDIKKIGEAMSSRIPLKTPSGKKGFFTPESTYNSDVKWAEVIDKFIDKFGKVSKDCREKLEELKKSEIQKELFCEDCPTVSFDELMKSGNMFAAGQAIIRVSRAIGIEDITSAFNDYPDLRGDVIKFIGAMAPLVNQRGVMEAAGIKKNANISNRNCAMTDVAKMLGCNHLLANSVPMTIVIDGKEQKGVFMESADGNDIHRLKEDDLIFKANGNSFNEPQFLKQMIDLEVLDFICGNVDRHSGNMIYQFDKNEKGKVVLKGIKGIDNDCSFGTPDVYRKKPVLHLVSIDQMQYIRQETLNKLLTIDKEKLEITFASYNFSKDEIDAVCRRVEMVKKAVKKDKIKVVPEDFFDGKDIKKMEFNKDNYLCRMQEWAEDFTKQSLNPKKEIDKSKDTTIHYVVDDACKAVMYNKQNEITALRDKMDKAKAIFHNSSEYTMMESRFKKIETLTKEIGELDDPGKIPQDKAEALEQAYTELVERAFRYVQLKKLVPSTELGKMRRDLAQDLMEFAHDTLKEIEMGPKKEAEPVKDAAEIEEADVEMGL